MRLFFNAFYIVHRHAVEFQSMNTMIAHGGQQGVKDIGKLVDKNGDVYGFESAVLKFRAKITTAEQNAIVQRVRNHLRMQSFHSS